MNPTKQQLLDVSKLPIDQAVAALVNRADRTLDDEANVDLRISVIPTLHGEDFAIRLLGRGLKAHRIDALGMTRDQLGDFSAMIESPGGLIVLTGPTGSGKTATLYAALMR